MRQMLELTSVRNWKSTLRSLDDGALIHCILCYLDKDINDWKKIRKLNYKRTLCQNAALPLNGTFHQQNVGRFVGPQAAQTRPGWAMLMRGRSFLGQSSRYLAMITRPVLTKLFKACAMIVVLIPCYDSIMSSRTRHKSASNRHALNYWLTYTMADIYLMMVL